MRNKRLITSAALVTSLCVLASFPSYALDLTAYYGGDSTKIQTVHDSDLGEVRFAVGHKAQTPGWMWIDGNCYYFLDRYRQTKVMNGTTPDGYTVDEQGRWVVNGEVQYNGYGTVQIGTDELYAGKSDAERWLVMRKLLEENIAKYQQSTPYGVAMRSFENQVDRRWPYPACSVINNAGGGEDYIYLEYVNQWCDSPDAYGDNVNELTERIVKIVCGDHLGQELFDDLRRAGEGTKGGPDSVPYYDENGQPEEYINEDGLECVRMITLPSSSDGIDFSKFNINKWQGRTTDYGKTLYFGREEGNYGRWTLTIR